MNDLISREAALKEMTSCVILVTNDSVDAVTKTIEVFTDKIKNLPSAEPERKTGEWREHIFDGIMGGRPRVLMCTMCNRISMSAYRYCPNCGARMEEQDG